MENKLDSDTRDKRGVALVSGATGGIGRAICGRLSQVHKKVVMLGRDIHKLEKAREEIEKAEQIHGILEVQQIDICDPENVESVVDTLYRGFEQLELLVHAAGDGPVAPFLETDETLWQSSVQGKLLGTVRLTRAVAAKMVQNKQGNIIVINGVFSKEPDPMFPINSLVNCGLAGFAKAIAKDLGRSGLRVNVINPGATITPLWEQIADEMATRTGVTTDDINNMVKEKIPIGRLAVPSDVAKVVDFLGSKKAYYLNGASIDVDGGATSAI